MDDEFKLQLQARLKTIERRLARKAGVGSYAQHLQRLRPERSEHLLSY
jgi:hypothetical protein